MWIRYLDGFYGSAPYFYFRQSHMKLVIHLENRNNHFSFFSFLNKPSEIEGHKLKSHFLLFYLHHMKIVASIETNKQRILFLFYVFERKRILKKSNEINKEM